jgi:hypothetical protein
MTDLSLLTPTAPTAVGPLPDVLQLRARRQAQAATTATAVRAAPGARRGSAGGAASGAPRPRHNGDEIDADWRSGRNAEYVKRIRHTAPFMVP